MYWPYWDDSPRPIGHFAPPLTSDAVMRRRGRLGHISHRKAIVVAAIIEERLGARRSTLAALVAVQPLDAPLEVRIQSRRLSRRDRGDRLEPAGALAGRAARRGAFAKRRREPGQDAADDGPERRQRGAYQRDANLGRRPGGRAGVVPGYVGAVGEEREADDGDDAREQAEGEDAQEHQLLGPVDVELPESR